MNKLNATGAVIGTIGSLIVGLLGGWSEGLQVLCIFMLIDFTTGIITALLGKSHKTTTGTLGSNAIFKGVAKKIFMLLMVVVGAQLDLITGASYIRDAVVIAYIVTECISIIENAGLIGVPIPKVITKVIDILKQKEEAEPEKEDKGEDLKG